MYNAAPYIERCIESVLSQDYDNYHMYIIDDASSDNSYELAKQWAGSHVTVIKNDTNRGAVYNQIQVIRQYCQDTDIVMLLDGDDSLVNDNTVFTYYNNLYDGTTEFSYGSCWSMVDNIPLISQPYPEAVKAAKAYRKHHFNWIMPYTHLRTFRKYLLNSCEDQEFQDNNGAWFKAGGDGSVFYALIERADPGQVKCVQDIVYNYNDISPLNDYKVNAQEQNVNARMIVGRSLS
jgi:glycosyltransferase involved in cell wall biosynthesis